MRNLAVCVRSMFLICECENATCCTQLLALRKGFEIKQKTLSVYINSTLSLRLTEGKILIVIVFVKNVDTCSVCGTLLLHGYRYGQPIQSSIVELKYMVMNYIALWSC